MGPLSIGASVRGVNPSNLSGHFVFGTMRPHCLSAAWGDGSMDWYATEACAPGARN